MMRSTDNALSKDWLEFQRNDETRIESVHAHFKGHAYDPHDHDELLLGVTRQGLQRFSCHRSVHTSSPGKAILIEPGAVHDGHSAQTEGFTYIMLYLPQLWVASAMQQRNLGDIAALSTAFRHTLTDDPLLSAAIENAWFALHYKEGLLARDESLDRLMTVLARHIVTPRQSAASNARNQMYRVRDYLHDQMSQDIGLDELSTWSGIDRFRLSREFKKVFGQSPHAWLVRLRLRTARKLLAQGVPPAIVACQVGFSDQSHLGRWFQRAYRMTPMMYQNRCSNVLS